MISISVGSRARSSRIFPGLELATSSRSVNVPAMVRGLQKSVDFRQAEQSRGVFRSEPTKFLSAQIPKRGQISGNPGEIARDIAPTRGTRRGQVRRVGLQEQSVGRN